MKKIKFGSIEVLGYIGLFVWIAVNFMRKGNLSGNAIYLFSLGVLPNLGAAWIMTMFGKWIVLFVFKQNYTIKKHCIICLIIVGLALVSEFIHDSFLDSPSDICDILLTIAAQLAMFFAPIASKDKYFKGYD